MSQIPLRLKLSDGREFADFYPAPACREPLQALRDVAKADGGVFLTGAPGSGKSHLLQACCAEALGAGRSAWYLALDTPGLPEPADMVDAVQGVDVLCLDNIDAVAGNAAWEQALFLLCNDRRLRGSFVLGNGRTPLDSGIALPDLRSRLSQWPLYRLPRLDDGDWQAALQHVARRRGIGLDASAVEYLLKRVPRDGHVLFELLERLENASLAEKRRITLPFVRELLESGALEGV